MINLNNFLTFEHESEHNLEYDLLVKKNYSTPKIYSAKGNLNKRWYVYFSFRNPETGKLERMKNIYGITNNYKTKEDHLSILTTYRRKLIILLKEGFNPFKNNTELFVKINTKQKVIAKKVTPKQEDVPQNSDIPTEPQKTIKEAFEFALHLKKRVINITSYRGLSNRMENFLSWMEKVHPELKTIDKLSKK